MAEIETYAKPMLLYRYRSLRSVRVGRVWRADRSIVDREVRTIQRNFIFCPRYTDMNDPMEGIYNASQKVRARDDYNRFVRDVHDEKLGLGIASFSETWDNELMWAHYADGFRGICVAYSLLKLLEGLDDDHALARIVYSDRPYNLNLAGKRNQDIRARAVLSTKNLKWNYEREWRLFASVPGEAFYNNDAVRYVYLGARMAQADRTMIEHRLRAAGVAVRRTRVDGYVVERL
jgi:hypothetical protein